MYDRTNETIERQYGEPLAPVRKNPQVRGRRASGATLERVVAGIRTILGTEVGR